MLLITEFYTFASLNQKAPAKMNMLKKLTLLASILITAVLISSCSKSTFSHNYQARSRASASHIDPVTKKTTPVRKNYIIPGKRKRILGQEKPKI